ncbi:DUF4397 domain-containing protein [Pedobacter sp. CCM 8938]|uniref:DUF4397 domain-containing protein n=2 Tax=Pedobacter fastidiosus TaxID=2765361 RepID=A0ABR7KM87_9SPHI|nr:DUF4397 domain-containing protein [Pedobacter fastidiosus]MBC6108848.1 DUF4397 domain-containing protein [Pedobacter fastidiosus]
MTSFSLKFLSSRFSALSVILIALAFTSCKKEDTVDPTLSALRVINASPSSATYNVYLDGSLINAAELPFAGSLSYVQKTAGTYSLKFTTGSSVESLLTKSINMNQSVYQSFFLINKPGALDGLYVTDDLNVPSADKAYIRFVNLSPDAPALDLAKTGATTALITNKAFKVASSFISIDPGTYSFDAKDTSTGLIKTTLSSTTFVAGYHYDVICGGLISPANDTERALTLQALLIK